MWTHPFHDIEVEALADDPPASLVKILAQDGRRFTYLVRIAIDEDVVGFLRRMIDAGVTSDLVIEAAHDGTLNASESPEPLKKHG